MTLRNILFQGHLWIGLILGVFFVLIGISGTALMFRGTPGIGQRVPDIRVAATGTPLSLEEIAAAAAASTTVPAGSSTTIVLPRAEDMPAQVRFAPAGQRFVRGPASANILVDPASGEVLGTFTPGMTSFMRFFHDLHGQLFLGRTGRQVVGWLGVGMTFLGLSGLYLWWPKKKVWKYAFIVRREAKGLRFHRELHGAVGIWTLIVFMIVSVTGVAIVFPQLVRSSLSLVTAQETASSPPPFGRPGNAPPTVEMPDGATAIGADAAVAVVRLANPHTDVQSVTLADGPDRPITVTVGPGRGTPVYVDPYRGSVIARQAETAPTLADNVSRAMRRLHAGDDYGPIYWGAVFLSGFLPALFVYTGLTMWLTKRRNRRAVRRLRAQTQDAGE